MGDTSVPKALEGLQISKTKELKGTEKRDSLRAWELECQTMWEQKGFFHADAPTTAEVPSRSISAAELRDKYPKWFGTIAYPYMNGVLHIGHAFSFSKVEFTAGWERMNGRRALWPQGYHCTGLPIKVCADKLTAEVKLFGQEFEKYEEEPVVEATPAPAPTKGGKKEDVTKFSATKGKMNAKTVKAKYQFQIMLSMGIPKQEIHRFADAQYWLEYFPPLCKSHLSQLGCRIDWRRQFVTTDANPFYDSFVSWQMRKLKELEKIKFGKRYTIYSVKDAQPCMDHDRSEGEALGVQEYTGIKMKVVEFSKSFADAVQSKLPEGSNVFLVAATLRPETMYGQTSCFVGPKLQYVVVRASTNNYYVMTERGAKNIAFQGQLAEEFAIPEKLAEVQGSDIIGSVVKAPLSVHGQVRVLPMDTVLATKGSGVVTSVPSDSPDDYVTVQTLAKKADFYGIKKEWAELEIIPIIETPTYGNLTAPELCKRLKITTPKDTKLAEAKDLAYKEGFYQGIMLVGPYKGQKVEAAKNAVRQDLIDAGDAFPYAEPEGRIVSRSGDECITALLDQWFMDYGEQQWKEQALGFVENDLKTYSPETQHNFKAVLNWLNQWAVSRGYGLGTKLPWDPVYLVESLSDSTIYMAYYTVAHYLHSDLYGRAPGLAKVAPEQMKDIVWDYLFCRTELSDEVLASGITKESLESMRREFEYFYPLDLRVSGKDLMPNHLTFFIYNHLALFPREYWPKGVRINGHLLLNAEKMSKSTGNFMTLQETVAKYGADATRIAMADAGDGINDSNFEEDVADNSILALFTKRDLFLDLIKKEDELRTGEYNSFQDALFSNEIHLLVHQARQQYELTNYKLALKSSWYDFTSAWSTYKEACAAGGIKMHKELVRRFIELQALTIGPLAPHWAEYLLLEVLKRSESIQLAQWPDVPAADPALTAANDFVRSTASSITGAEGQALKKKAKGKEASFDPKKPKKLTIFTTKAFPAWQEKYIELMKAEWDTEAKALKDDKALDAQVRKMGEMKKAMPFVQDLKKRLKTEAGAKVLERKLAFDEQATLLAMVPGVKRTSGIQEVVVIECQEGSKTGKDLTNGAKEVEVTAPQAEAAVPGNPAFAFENIAS